MGEERVLLIDSDAFVLLAGAGIMLHTLKLLGFDIEHARRLEPLPYQLDGNRFSKTYPEHARQAACRLCKKVKPLAEQPADCSLRQTLTTVDNIDDGEALMFALMAEHPEYDLCSGDNRAIIAVATNPCLASLRKQLTNRIMSFEGVLQILVDAYGTKSTAKAFASVTSCRTSLRTIFSKIATADHIRGGVASYLGDLVDKVGNGFLMAPNP